MPLRIDRLTRSCWLLAALLVFICSVAHAAPPTYRVDYLIGFDPAAGDALARITVTPGDGQVRRLRLSIDPERHHGFRGDGEIKQNGRRLTWRPPNAGGELRFRYKVDQQRKGGYVARITKDWALLRVDRLVPPIAAAVSKGAVAVSDLRFDLPSGWDSADIGYLLDKPRGVYPIVNPGRRFQRPLGWIIAGDVGNRREKGGEMDVSVAAPKGAAMRRNDLLALVNATALEMRLAFGRLPPKVLIVGADDPFWRGGLSGPYSMFIHADRPLISENGTSTLIHELVHVATRIRGAAGDDWIAEGVAEFYSIELLRRSGLITSNRADMAFAWMARHGEAVRNLRAKRSFGPRTARAVTLLKALDDEIRRASDEQHDLDEVIQRLLDRGPISTEMLREAAEAVLGRPSKALKTPLLD